MKFNLLIGGIVGLFMYIITYWNPFAALIAFIIVVLTVKET